MWHSLELSPKRFFSLEVQPPSIQEHLVAENVQSVQVHDWLHDSSVLPLIAGVLLPFEDVLIRHRYLTTAAAWYPRDLAGATVETRYLDALKLFINKHMLLDGYSLDYIDHSECSIPSLLINTVSSSASQQCKVITLSSPAQTVSGTPLSWRWPQDMCRRLGLPSFNGTDEKKALCVVKFVPPGALSESDVAISEDTVCPRESIANVMANLLNTAKEVRAPFGVLTDEICIIVFETIRYTEYPGMAVFTAADKPLRMILGALIHQEVCLMHLSAMDGARFLTQQSAVTKEWPMIQREVLRSREQALMKMKLCDWNPAALRDSPEQVDIFEFWAQNRRQQALQEAPFADVFDAFTDGFVKCYEKPIRLELPPLQSNQIAIGKAVNIFEQWMRPRNHALSQILEGQAFSFTVKKLLSTGGNRYSHLFLGKVNGCDEELLLKLYDERLFPIDDIKSQLSEERELYQSENLPEKFHLRDHECDFIARELAAYSALQSFQGSILPQCYGFHL
ncbi:hypothetical protein OBBRIDRAFT_887813, partial [Obba rivulosa]